MEEWRDIKGYEGYYQISNLGNVRSLDRIILCGWHHAEKKFLKGIKLKPQIDKKGYYRYGLNKRGVNKSKKAYRLVLEAFVGKCPKGMEACHTNGIKSDNRVENLRWDTCSNNMKDKMRHKQCACGEKIGTGKLKRGEVLLIRKLLSRGFSHRFIAKMFKVRHPSIIMINKRKTWKHI